MELGCEIKNVIIQAGTNNIGNNTSTDIAKGILCIVLTLLKDPKLNVVFTGLLPRDKRDSFHRKEIATINKILNDFCSKLYSNGNIRYIHRSSIWTRPNGDLDEKLFWKDSLHLSKAGNCKFDEFLCKEIKQVDKEKCYKEYNTSLAVNKEDFPSVPRLNIIESTTLTTILTKLANSHANILKLIIPSQNKFARHEKVKINV